MELKYPLARLSVLYQLHGKKRTCEQAMITAAYEGGLIETDNLEDYIKTSHGSCGAMEIAKNIAHRKMSQLHGDDQKKVDLLTNSIIERVETETQNYILQKEKSASADESELENCSSQKDLICGNLAPVIIDLLIQQLRLH